MRRFALVLGLFLTLIVAGCEKQAAPAPAETAAPDLAVSEPKEVARPAEDQFGHLPEDVGVSVGTQVPDFTVKSAGGKSVALADLVSGRPTVVFFYRGGWCPYCNFQVREFQQNAQLFEDAGIGITAISVDQPDGSLAAKRAYEITYPILSDPDLKAHRAFNVAMEIDAATRTLYKGYGIDLEQWSGRDHHTIAVPSVFVIDETRTVRWAHADLDYKTRPSALHVLGAAKTALKQLPRE